MEKIGLSEKVANKEFIEHIGEKKTRLNNILHKEANWIRHTQRIAFFVMQLKVRRWK
jgi:hypothetical protein